MRRRKILPTALLVAGLVFSGMSLVQAGTAQAVAGVTTVVSTSATNSTAIKTVTITCPAGTFLYGPGAAINGGGGSVTLVQILPLGTTFPTQARVLATEVGLYSSSWSLTASATCGPSTANLQVVPGVRSASDSSTTKESDANCPAGLKLYGMGFDIAGGGDGGVFIHDIIPGSSISLNSVTTRATEHGAYAGNWSLRAFLICATPAATMSRVLALSATDTVDTKSASRSCPAGTTPHGAGAQVFGSGTAVDGQITIERVLSGSLAGIATGNANGTVSLPWTTEVYVLCSS